MQIDNSAASTFRFCPDKYRERYLLNLEKIPSPEQNDSRIFGHRIHEKLEEHFLSLKGTPRIAYPPTNNTELELEVDAMYAGYRARYPDEPFDVVDVERVFALKIPGTAHTYTGKIDGIIRYNSGIFAGQVAVLEHKTEKRNSRRNQPQDWAAKAQVSLYIWAVEQLTGERPAHILLDVLRRQSPAGREEAVFYRDILERSVEQSEEAIQDIAYVADAIEHLEQYGWPEYDVAKRWPQNTDQCSVNSWKCDYFSLHVGEVDRQELIQIQYQKAEQYLAGL